MEEHHVLLEAFLASTIHEAKNHLGNLIGSLDQLTQELNISQDCPKTQGIKKQLSAINYHFNQVLVHYGAHRNGYRLHLDEVYLDDFFEDTALRNQNLLGGRQTKITFNCHDNDVAFFDEYLLNNALDTLIMNAVNAQATHITLSYSDETDHYTTLLVDDNGKGFPETLLHQPLGEAKDHDIQHNKTGLGLYLAHIILEAHKNEGRAGFLSLHNHCDKPGACVKLHIP